LDKYGYLYDWNSACNVCPTGWKLPSNDDYLELSNYLGSDYKSKMMERNRWTQNDTPTNESGFNGIPAGAINHQGAFYGQGKGAYFWTSTGIDGSWAYARELGANAGNWASHLFGTNKLIGMSVRCIKDKNFAGIKQDNQSSKNSNNEIEVTFTHFVDGQRLSTDVLTPCSEVYKSEDLIEFRISGSGAGYSVIGKSESGEIVFKKNNLSFPMTINLNDPINKNWIIKVLNFGSLKIIQKGKVIYNIDLHCLGE
jgi:uncharacterized protein (TIGR02145 family)